MRNQILIILIIVLLSGCSDNELFKSENGKPANKQSESEKEIAIKSGRLVFSNMESFFGTVEQIHKMNEAEIKQWISKYSFKSLDAFFKSEPGEDVLSKYQGLDELPHAYYLILNGNAEVQIGNDIVWYNNGIKHFTSNEIELKKLRANPSLSKNTAKYFNNIHQVSNSGKANGNERIIIGLSGKTNYQKEVRPCSGNNYRKHVFELKSFLDDYPIYGGNGSIVGYSYYSLLYIDVKLEYRRKDSGPWYNSTDYRFIEYGFTSDVKLIDFNGPHPYISYWNTALNPIQRTSNLQIALFEISSNYFYGTVVPYYDVSVNGWLYQALSTTQYSPDGSHCNGFAKGGLNNEIVW